MGKIGENICYLAVLITAGIETYRFVSNYGTDLKMCLGTFAIIFLYGLLMVIREQSQSIDSTLLKSVRYLGVFVQTLALPLFATAMFIGYNVQEIVNYVPLAVGCLSSFLFFTNTRTASLVEFLVYATSAGLAIVGGLNDNYLLMAAGIVFFLGEFVNEHAKIRFDLYPHQQYNYFLSVFTVIAYEAMVQSGNVA